MRSRTPISVWAFALSIEAIVLLSASAIAQQAPLTAEQVRAQASAMIDESVASGNAQANAITSRAMQLAAQLAQANATIKDLQTQLDAAKAPKTAAPATGDAR